VAQYFRASSVCRPIIGILSLPNSVPGFNSFQSYFPASYVKWLESAGARVIPLLYDAPAATIKQQLQYINGAFFTGGGTDFTNPDGSLTQFAATAQVIFNESVEAWTSRGEVFPLWGTCQGHELVSFLAAGANETVLSSGFDSENYTIPLTFTSDAQSSRLYGPLGEEVMNIFATQPVTMNNHQMGVAPSDVPKFPSLNSRFTVLSTNVDREGKPFVSSMEGKNGLPIFTTQYHPEKVQFEWWNQEVINHSYDSVIANHWLSLIFVNQTRSNGEQ
jgi:gamma-glutamyl hydrolase